MDLGLDGRVYVLTGASRGLGFATASALVAEGARVVISARDADAVADAVDRLGGDDHAHGVAADLADPDTARRLVDAATARFGRIDGALISVGGPPHGSTLQVTDEQWRQSFESVFLGAVRTARVIAAALSEGGALALVASSSAKSPIVDLGISNGLRPGLSMVAKELADELGPRGIRVLSLLPGRVLTGRLHELFEATGDAERAAADAAARIPLRRVGEPAEFARVAAFVLSPAASYLTGVALPVDGGAMRTL
ncbi:SDR family oxidoreductase [Catenuloplanes atrovinosus]|uniref:3-oxoacyl-[acyl-carrier protein] reductase n=1 Tax=Catenuloplanes atrovinosus TaxID=137266 RepID=A0AAE3YQX4_9ACTN|nr:SDR family oxidoreductase [Catenuloplanes atrovinosus]MDR7277970.1 3-oxoacyl-[acyl-carrier protein] reductase [Catenuloplanes atrovinosus]